MAESVLRIVIDSRNAERNARNVANELQNIERNGDHASRSMDSMSVATRSLVGYMGGLVTIGAAISKMDAYTGLQNRLKLVTDSQVELNTAMNDTFGIAQKTASSWDSVAMVYQRFADNADRLNITMAQTSALTETVSKAISVSGGSAASAEAALMQFGQALASGVLRGEEFNSIAEQAPGLLKAIAFGLNTNVGSLRAMAADGKITGDVLVDALGKAKPYIDDLFNKTDFTISQSFTKLSNEVTKFVGEAGKGSGAASALSDSIGFLAKNLSTIADIAIVGGVAMLTKTILAQTVAIQGSITASVARRAADAAVLQSQVQLAALEVQRTRQIAAQAISEIGLARQELNSATTRTARAAATVRLTQAEIAHRIALNQTTAAIATNTAAQNALNASRAIGTRMLALVGGPIGAITLGVAGLAAGYMYLKNRTAEANAKLEEQGKVAEKTNEELTKLSGNDKKNAVSDLTAAFNAQNAELSKSKESVDAVLFAIRAASVENEKARKVTEDARKGVISYDEAIKRLNQMNIPTDLYDMLKKQVIQYDENSEKAGNSQRTLGALGKVVQLAGNLFQNSAVQVAKNTDELNKNETAAEKAARAQKQYTESLSGRTFDAVFTKNLLAKNFTEGQTNALLEAANYARKQGVEFTKAMAQEALRLYNLEKANKDTLEAKNEAEKKITKEKEKQQRVLEASTKVQANAAKYNFGGLESKYQLPKGTLSAIHAIETGNTGKTNQVNKQSGATGGFQFLKGTADQYGVKDRTDMAQSAEGAAKYMSYLLKLFKGDLEKAVRAYHAGEGNVQKGKNIGKYNNDYWSKFKGYTASENGFIGGDVGAKEWEKQLEEATRLLEEQAELRKNLEFNIASEVTRIRSKLSDDLQEIDKAGFSPKETKRLIAEYQTRADNDIAIAQQALKTKLDDYGAFKKTESRLLEDSFNERKFYAARDLELTKEQRDKAVALLDEQLKQEQALLMLAQETRLFQYREALMAEAELVRERYRIEMLELSKIVDIEERRIAMQAKTTAFIRGSLAPVGTPIIESDKGKSNTQLLQEETGRELLAMQNRHLAAQVAAKDNAEELLRIERDYIAAKEQLHAQHDIKLVDARQADHDNQLQFYGQMLSQAGSVWGDMTQMIKDAKGENSKTFKAMFLAQQSMAIAQQIINTELAAGATTAQTGIFGLPAAAVIRGIGYASVGLIAAQTIAGFETGGYTGSGGRKDVAGVVHGQEYVLNAAATKRVGVGTLDAINSGKSLGGATVIQPKVVINNYSSEKVETSTNQDGELMVTIGKMLDHKIDSGVDRGIQRNLRQGHPLANAIKGR